mgnify:CR=1 FL=1
MNFLSTESKAMKIQTTDGKVHFSPLLSLDINIVKNNLNLNLLFCFNLLVGISSI